MATHSSILAWEIPWRRSLVGYSPWGLKESDTTEPTQLSDFHIHSSFLRMLREPLLGVLVGDSGGGLAKAQKGGYWRQRGL